MRSFIANGKKIYISCFAARNFLQVSFIIPLYLSHILIFIASGRVSHASAFFFVRSIIEISGLPLSNGLSMPASLNCEIQVQDEIHGCLAMLMNDRCSISSRLTSVHQTPWTGAQHPAEVNRIKRRRISAALDSVCQTFRERPARSKTRICSLFLFALTSLLFHRFSKRIVLVMRLQ